MAGSQSNAYKNSRRNEAKILTRQAIFIHEYIQTKYKDIYREAATLYNELNKKYTKKPDLRKTTEFRLWKNSVSVSNGESGTYIPRQKAYKYNRTEYRDIILTPTTETPPKENHHLNRCLTGMTMCLNIPLMTPPRHNASEETVIQEGDQTMDPSTPQQISSVIQEGDQTMDPSILDQISPEIVEKIIRELQLDPNLKDMMDDVEQQINTEEELVGLEIDLPELDDLLEEELGLW